MKHTQHAKEVPMTLRLASALHRLRRTERAQFEALPPTLKLALGDYEAEERRRAMLASETGHDSIPI